MLDLKRKTLHGALAKLSGLGASIVVRVGLIAILARLLHQSDFGLVAMVSVVIAFLELFSSAGLSSAAIQRSVVTDQQISTLFWINILIGARMLCPRSIFSWCREVWLERVPDDSEAPMSLKEAADHPNGSSLHAGISDRTSGLHQNRSHADADSGGT